MDRMVINCFLDGSAEHTLKDGYLNPFPTAIRDVDRMTIIEFHPSAQKFYITWLLGPEASNTVLDEWGSILMFHTYEAAVEYEIALVDGFRCNNVRMLEDDTTY